MKRFPVERMIGLARDRDGIYRPTNERSRAKMEKVFRAANAPEPYQYAIDRSAVGVFSDFAKAAGFKVITTTGRILPH